MTYILRNRYRIICDETGRDYDAQVLRWYWPFWTSISGPRDYSYMARSVIECHKRGL